MNLPTEIKNVSAQSSVQTATLKTTRDGTPESCRSNGYVKRRKDTSRIPVRTPPSRSELDGAFQQSSHHVSKFTEALSSSPVPQKSSPLSLNKPLPRKPGEKLVSKLADYNRNRLCYNGLQLQAPGASAIAHAGALPHHGRRSLTTKSCNAVADPNASLEHHASTFSNHSNEKDGLEIHNKTIKRLARRSDPGIYDAAKPSRIVSEGFPTEFQVKRLSSTAKTLELGPTLRVSNDAHQIIMGKPVSGRARRESAPATPVGHFSPFNPKKQSPGRRNTSPHSKILLSDSSPSHRMNRKPTRASTYPPPVPPKSPKRASPPPGPNSSMSSGNLTTGGLLNGDNSKDKHPNGKLQPKKSDSIVNLPIRPSALRLPTRPRPLKEQHPHPQHAIGVKAKLRSIFHKRPTASIPAAAAAPAAASRPPRPRDNIAEAIPLVLALVEQARAAQSQTTKEALAALAKVLSEAITHARDAERASRAAQLAADEARVAVGGIVAVVDGVGVVLRLTGGR